LSEVKPWSGFISFLTPPTSLLSTNVVLVWITWRSPVEVEVIWKRERSGSTNSVSPTVALSTPITALDCPDVPGQHRIGNLRSGHLRDQGSAAAGSPEQTCAGPDEEPELALQDGSPVGGGGRVVVSNVSEACPLDVVTSADDMPSLPGHQATSHPPPVVAWTSSPSLRTRETAVTSEAIWPSTSV
jgi:hypothetical protein